MKSRLAALGVPGVAARTFHSAALAQLHHFAPEAVGRILPTKALVLRQIANALPPPYKFRPAGDLATEIEWAKAQRIGPDAYRRELGEHEPPIPADLMATRLPRVRAAEGGARRDRLRGPARARDPAARERRAGAGDVPRRATARSPSTSTRTSTCSSRRCSSSGSATATTSASSATTTSRSTRFTGASPRWLLGFEAAASRARRSSGSSATTARRREVLELANRLVPLLEGAEKMLRPTRPAGPEPPSARVRDAGGRGRLARGRGQAARERGDAATRRWRCSRARTRGWPTSRRRSTTPASRSRARRCSSATRRGRLLKLLDRDASTGVAERVRTLAEEAGLLHVAARQARRARADAPGRPGAARAARGRARRRRAHRRRVRGRAPAPLRPGRPRDARRPPADLPPREGARVRRGLPAAARREGAAVEARAHAEELAEERRLLYVGITRARRSLALTWSKRPSPFLAELGRPAQPAPRAARRERREVGRVADPELYEALADVAEDARAEPTRSRRTSSSTTACSRRSPMRGRARCRSSPRIPGVGPAKLERYGRDVLAVVGGEQ